MFEYICHQTWSLTSFLLAWRVCSACLQSTESYQWLTEVSAVVKVWGMDRSPHTCPLPHKARQWYVVRCLQSVGWIPGHCEELVLEAHANGVPFSWMHLPTCRLLQMLFIICLIPCFWRLIKLSILSSLFLIHLLPFGECFVFFAPFLRRLKLFTGIYFTHPLLMKDKLIAQFSCHGYHHQLPVLCWAIFLNVPSAGHGSK